MGALQKSQKTFKTFQKKNKHFWTKVFCTAPVGYITSQNGIHYLYCRVEVEKMELNGRIFTGEN